MGNESKIFGKGSFVQLFDKMEAEMKAKIEEDARTGAVVPVKAVTGTDKLRIIYSFLRMEGSEPAVIRFNKNTAEFFPLFGKWAPDVEEFIGKNAPNYKEFCKHYNAFSEKWVSGIWKGNNGTAQLISMNDLDFIAIRFSGEGKERKRTEDEFNDAFNKAFVRLQSLSYEKEDEDIGLLMDEHLTDIEMQENYSYYLCSQPMGLGYTEYNAKYKIQNIIIPENKEIEFLDCLAPYVHFAKFDFTNRTDFYGIDDEDWTEEGYDNFRNAYYSKEWSWFTADCETIPGNYDITKIKITIWKDSIGIDAKCRCKDGLYEFARALKAAASDAGNGSD